MKDERFDWLFPVGVMVGIVAAMVVIRIVTGASVLGMMWQLLTRSPR